MRDRNVEFPNRFRLVKVEGTDDIYDLEAAPGEVVEEGTLLNKANLLTDETAALLGMEQENPTVNEAFERLRGLHDEQGADMVYRDWKNKPTTFEKLMTGRFI